MSNTKPFLTNGELSIEIITRFTGNSRGTPIAKKGFIDGALWVKEKANARIAELEKERDEFAIKFLEFSLTRLYRADSHPSILIEQFKQSQKC